MGPVVYGGGSEREMTNTLHYYSPPAVAYNRLTISHRQFSDLTSAIYLFTVQPCTGYAWGLYTSYVYIVPANLRNLQQQYKCKQCTK